MDHLEVILIFPDEPGSQKRGILHLTDDNRHWLEYTAYGYEHMDKQFPVIYATHERTGDQYTCIQCTARYMDVEFCRLDITELIINEHSPSAIEPYYLGLVVEINGLTNWLGRNAFTFSYSSLPEASAATLPNQHVAYHVSADTILSLESWCFTSMEPQQVSFVTASQLGIYCDNPSARLDLYNHALNFLRIQSLFLDQIETFAKIELIDPSGERKDLERKDIRSHARTDHFIFLKYPDVEVHFSEIIRLFYKDLPEMTRLIDLMNESRRNRTPEISFLNLTTALEVFHKHFFVTGFDNKKNQLNQLLHDRKVSSDWVNASRYLHLLELTGEINFLTQRIDKPLEFCKQLRNTRNWYTHYDRKITAFWTPSNLVLINKLIEGLLKAVILQKLSLPDALINKLLFADAEIFFHNNDTNPYSVTYKPGVFSENEKK
jgi:hypothetical protein